MLAECNQLPIFFLNLLSFSTFFYVHVLVKIPEKQYGMVDVLSLGCDFIAVGLGSRHYS